MKKLLLLIALLAPFSLAARSGHTLTSTSDRSQVFSERRVKLSRRAEGTVITLQPEQRFQTMDGFGAALTGSSCYNLLRMTAADRHAFLERTFSLYSHQHRLQRLLAERLHLLRHARH